MLWKIFYNIWFVQKTYTKVREEQILETHNNFLDFFKSYNKHNKTYPITKHISNQIKGKKKNCITAEWGQGHDGWLVAGVCSRGINSFMSPQTPKIKGKTFLRNPFTSKQTHLLYDSLCTLGTKHNITLHLWARK